MRPLRIDLADGWYHTMARGFERRVVFGEERECEHFLGLLEEMVARYGVKVHAYVFGIGMATMAVMWLCGSSVGIAD